MALQRHGGLGIAPSAVEIEGSGKICAVLLSTRSESPQSPTTLHLLLLLPALEASTEEALPPAALQSLSFGWAPLHGTLDSRIAKVEAFSDFGLSGLYGVAGFEALQFLDLGVLGRMGFWCSGVVGTVLRRRHTPALRGKSCILDNQDANP